MQAIFPERAVRYHIFILDLQSAHYKRNKRIFFLLKGFLPMIFFFFFSRAEAKLRYFRAREVNRNHDFGSD